MSQRQPHLRALGNHAVPSASDHRGLPSHQPMSEPIEKRLRATNLCLGRLTAVLADELSLKRMERSIIGAKDYFEQIYPRLNPERLAADHLYEALADATRRLYFLQDEQGAETGLLDLALDTPGPREATIVLMVLAKHQRGWGLGRETATALFRVLAQNGFVSVRLGVRPKETAAAHFWTAMGMWESGQASGVRLFELPLSLPSRD